MPVQDFIHPEIERLARFTSGLTLKQEYKLENLIIGAAGALLGFASGLLAPWVKRSVERDAARTDARRQLVAAWRAAISTNASSARPFGDSHEYASLRAHMKPDVVSKLEQPRTYIVANEGRGQNARTQILFDEIARIEKEWNLV